MPSSSSLADVASFWRLPPEDSALLLPLPPIVGMRVQLCGEKWYVGGNYFQKSLYRRFLALRFKAAEIMAPVKKPQSSYLLFCNERRKQVMDENPGARIGDIQKIISAQWKELKPEEKEVYVQLAAKDKALPAGATGQPADRRGAYG